MTSSLIASAMLRDPLYHIECLTAPSYTKYLISSPAVPLILAEQEGVEIIDHPPAAAQPDATNASNAEAAFDATKDPFGFTADAQASLARPSSILELLPQSADKSDDEPR